MSKKMTTSLLLFKICKSLDAKQLKLIMISHLKIKKTFIRLCSWWSRASYWKSLRMNNWCSRSCPKHSIMQKSIKSFGFIWSSMKSFASYYPEVLTRGRRLNSTMIKLRRMNWFKHRRRRRKGKWGHLLCGSATADLRLPAQIINSKEGKVRTEYRRWMVSFWKCTKLHQAKRRLLSLTMMMSWLLGNKEYNSLRKTEKSSQLMKNSTWTSN